MKEIALSQVATPLGDLTIVAKEEGLLLIHFSDVAESKIRQITKNHSIIASNPHLQCFQEELNAYFKGNLQTFTTPCVVAGTLFQKQTWQALERIPYGSTASYAQVAASILKPTAYRAVALANRNNLFAIRVPCHRVIKSNGSLCGYNGGIHRKQWLLDYEKRHQ